LTGRPVIFILAGVNGAGKSSIGGTALLANGLIWFNPDTFSRELRRKAPDMNLQEANASAWSEGFRRLRQAIDELENFAFETTLGGNSITAELIRAAHTHDIHIWYAGLASADLHIRRVAERVAAGGHDIDSDNIRKRYTSSPANLIKLMPFLHELQVYDNSTDADEQGVVPDPILVLHLREGKVLFPASDDELHATPDWIKPIVSAALKL